MKLKLIFALGLVTSSFANAQVVVDGKANDWTLPLKNYDAQAHLQYSVVNNDSMLYACVRITDTKFQMKAAKAGVFLLLDSTGKKKFDMSIHFPLKDESAAQRPAGGPGKMPSTQQVRAEVERVLFKFKSSGFLAGNGTFKTRNSEGLTVAGAYDASDVLTLEYQIPLRLCYHVLGEQDIDKKITLQFVVNALPAPQMPDGPPPMGEGRGMPPLEGGSMPDMQEMEQLFQTSKTTLKYTLLNK